MAAKDGRYRNYGTVVYPESAPENWLDIIGELKIPVFVSPLHDQDHNPDGEIKKPHYHVMFMFEGVKSTEQIEKLVASFGGVGREVVASIRGYARYLCHLDNPEKAQYDIDHVRSFGGADYISIIGLPTDKYNAIAEMLDWCEEKNIVCYNHLLIYARYKRSDWYRTLLDNGTLVMKEFLKSKKYASDNNIYIDMEELLNESC